MMLLGQSLIVGIGLMIAPMIRFNGAATSIGKVEDSVGRIHVRSHHLILKKFVVHRYMDIIIFFSNLSLSTVLRL